MTGIRFERLVGGSYGVVVDGDTVGHVFRVRFRTDRYPFGESQIPRHGRWRWVASPGVNDEDFATRRDAAAELVRRRLRP